MINTDLLYPEVTTLLPRFCDATQTTIEAVLKSYPESTMIAISSSNEESRSFQKFWDQNHGKCLLILRADPREQLELALAAIHIILEKKRINALGVIIGDGPDAEGFQRLSRRKWNDSFAQALSKSIRDLQVVEYSPSWRDSPPRIR